MTKHLHVRYSCPIHGVHISVKLSAGTVNYRQWGLFEGYVKLLCCVTAIPQISSTIFHLILPECNRLYENSDKDLS